MLQRLYIPLSTRPPLLTLSVPPAPLPLPCPALYLRWFNVIGVPLDATSSMLLLTTERLSAYEVERLVNISYQANWWTTDWSHPDSLLLASAPSVRRAR